MKNQIDLDWDDISWPEMFYRVGKIMKYQWVYSIEIMLSAKSGFHIYIKPYRDIPDSKYFEYRRKFKDDGFRLIEDVFFRKDEDHSNVMFERKTENGFVYQEETIFKIVRELKGCSRFKIEQTNSQRSILDFLRLDAGFHITNSLLPSQLIQM